MFLIPNVVQGRYFEGKISNRFGLHKYVHVRESEFPNQGNFCTEIQAFFCGIWIPEFWNPELDSIPLTIRIQNPSTTDKPQLGVQYPRLH